jgi:hypothetical protein
MSNYFVLLAAPAIESTAKQGYIEIEDWDGVDGFDDWGRGTPAAMQPAGPVEIKAVPHDGYKGLPDEFQDNSVPLMSKALKEAIEAAGADNVRYLPVTLRNTETGETYEYFAFNLIGLMSAADPANSKMMSHDGDFLGDTSIRDLVVDDARARDLLIFRMKEKFSVILVHKSIKEAIELKKIGSVKFAKPEDFVAL